MGDLDFTVKLNLHKGGHGAYIYLTQEHLAAALFGQGGRFDTVDPGDYVAKRTILDPGTGQILIRLKKERKPKTEG